ncbi:hypothetical protein OJAV_G00068890 [Oryzias javanicus]|uniref:Membrane-associated guanylate kinase, WW and PDZ domain-containing protein 2-like n=1 Tax=Oryzias javanicus TaxID=123683 RepID=A0A437D6M2_ORYJA|nr:hypothetical protein OJAV_G00068890 [Oryzias javanicus]
MYIDAFKRILFERLNCLKRMCVCQRQGSSSFAMSKTTGKKLHWRSKVQDSFVPLFGTTELGIAIGGGADYGEFPFVTSAPGGGLTVGDIILEIGGTPVLGMTLGDVRGVLNSCPHPIRIKTVSPGSTLCKDLRLYLSKCFTPGSVDSQLQQVIRENLLLRAIPCTTRQPRDGEISGVDYNFVSIEEFFSLEESGALLESGKFKGNYYGTPRPVHVSAESPPITYQEHRNLLRNFRTRSKSLSNLEKAAGEGLHSEDDAGLSGDSAGVIHSVPFGHRSPGRPRASSTGGDGYPLENGFISSKSGARIRGVMPDHWEQAFSDPGEPLYIERSPRRTSWQIPRPSSRETDYRSEWFTDQPEELRGFTVHAHLIKGHRGFGFNIVGGSRRREFLQVYSVTSSGPSALKTGDILVYINDACVLGLSHKEAVEMLKSVPVGHSVDIEVRRGYPLLYNPDGRLKQSPPRMLDSTDPNLRPTTTQPQSLHHLPRHPTPTPQTQYLNGLHSNGSYMEPGVALDANGNATAFASKPPPPYRRSSITNAGCPSPARPPRSHRSLARLQSLDPTLASQSDSEVVSHRASVIRNHNNNSLSTPPHLLRYGTSKSSESDLSTCTLPGTRLPMPESPHRPSSSPGGRAYAHLFRGHSSHLRPLSNPESPLHRGVNGFLSNTSPTASPSTLSSPGATSLGSGVGGLSGGELVPVALAQTEGDRGLGFSMTAGGPGGRVTVVDRVWDRKQCNSLQPGDAIVKINGADVQSLNFTQIDSILQEHTKQGEVILLVYRGGIYHSSVSPASIRRLPPPLLRPPPPPDASESFSAYPEALPLPRTSNSPAPSPTHSSLIQSTSFLESIPVTLTMDPKDWIDIGLEDEAVGISVPDSSLEKRNEQSRPLRGLEVVLRRKPGEGFGFVIASQDLEHGKAASLLPHRFVTVRRGSPAAKSGQIRPGDRLEAVEGRSVVTLPHRELAQILRRAGNTLRLTIVPRTSTHSTNFTEATEHEHKAEGGRGHVQSVTPGITAWIWIEAPRASASACEGGPASRSQKIQVSDQLVEINGNSTAGMTHSQAVEQIRRGGQRIHLVLKRGNGYVPDYGREQRITSPSHIYNPKEQGLAAVNSTGRRGRSSHQTRRSRSAGDKREKRTEVRSRRRYRSLKGDRSDLHSPISEPSDRSHESRDRRRRRKRSSHSLPRDPNQKYADSDAERRTVRGRKRDRDKGRSRGREERKSRSEERERRAKREERYSPSVQVERWLEERENEGNFKRNDIENKASLPIPSPTRRLPGLEPNWEVESRVEWDMAAEYRELVRHENQQAESLGFDRGDDEDQDTRSLTSQRPLPGVAVNLAESQRKPFSFLTSTLSVDQLEEADSESGDSLSDVSLSDVSTSAASISGLSATSRETGRPRAEAPPGLWLKPSEQRLVQFAVENRQPRSPS